MKKLAKLFSLLLVFAMAFSLFAACGAKEEATTENTENKTEDKAEASTDGGVQSQNKANNMVVVATANEPPTVAPHQHSAVAGSLMNILTHDTFLRLDFATLDPIPCIITEWETLSDKEWQFKIRDDVKFHDGSDLTTEDMVASMEYARAQSAYTQSYTEFWDKIEIVDDYTFKVTTKEVYAKTLLDMSSHYVLPSELIAEGEEAIAANPVGTGGYIFKDWTLGDSLTFEAFDGYWDGAPAIKTLKYRIIPEGSSRTIALEAGEIDYIVEVDNNDMGRLEETAGIATINQTGTAFNFLVLNNERAPFDNQDFRHFMNCAIDKDALVMVALNGYGTGNYTQTPIVFAGAATEIPDKLDKEMAQKYLDASGIDPKTVSFSCICSDDVKRRCGEVIQASLAEYGVTMNLESMDLATYLSVAAEGDFDTCIGGYTSSSMMSFVEGKFTEKQVGGSNWTRTVDPKIDQMYADLTQILDADERNAAMTELTNYINEICPQVPTYGANVTRAYNDDLKGVEISSSGTMYWCYVSWN
ncbi:MAG: hypothetical protein IKU27_06890 [Clostridia bacterium]|nr:hypothetical protein [Clostridia bacterium]